jgi:hypothetical protein
MNAVEDRLREALREQARHSPIDPDAWSKTVARTRSAQRWRAPAWSRFAIPAAAAAAVVAIVLGATTLVGHNPRGGSAPPAASASGAPTPPGPNDYLIQQFPPVSAIVPVKTTANGQTAWVFVWFGRMQAAAGGGTALCSETTANGYNTGGGCEPAQIPAHQVAVLTGGQVVLKLGVCSGQVTSVSAQLPGDRQAAGMLVSGRGFPDKVWLVSYLPQDNARIVFRNAKGSEAGHLTLVGATPFLVRPPSGGITVFSYPAGPAGGQAGTVTAYLVGGRVEFFNSDPIEGAFGTQQASGPPAVAVFIRAGLPGAEQGEFYGYAHENVARVVLHLSGGRQFTAQTFPGWQGSGLRLWAVPVPADLVAVPKYVALAYDAAGHVVSQLAYEARG